MNYLHYLQTILYYISYITFHKATNAVPNCSNIESKSESEYDVLVLHGLRVGTGGGGENTGSDELILSLSLYNTVQPGLSEPSEPRHHI